MAITWTRVQGKLDTAGTGTTRNLAFTSAVTSGNIVVGGVLTGASYQLLTGITDDKGNTYVLVNSAYNPTDVTGLVVTGFRSAGPITNSPQTLTFTFSPSATLIWIIQEEFHPSSAITGLCLDGSQIMTTGNTNGVLTTQAFTTLKNDTLLFNAAFSTGAATTGSGWTAGQGSGGQQMSQWRLAASPNSSNTATFASNTGAMWTTAFGVNGVARTSWEVRQNNMQRAANNTTTGTLVFPSTVAPGNIVVGGIAVGTNGNVSDITSIVDDKGNNYTILPNYTNNKGRAIFWSGGPLTNAPKTLTCTTSVTETVIYFLASEFIVPTGTSSVQLDGTPAYGTAGTDPNYNTPSLTTTANGSLIYTFADVSVMMEPSNGFWCINADRMSWSDAYIVQTSAGAITANWKNVGGAGGPNVLAIAGFKATTSGGMTMATYTVFHQRTTAITGTTGTAANRDAAIAAVVSGTVGPTGREVSVYTCDLVGMTGPTGIYGSSLNMIQPITGSTFNATSRDDACAQATVAGPTGPGSGIDIWYTIP